MKVGDLVVRAYAYSGVIPGVIVEKYLEDIPISGEDGSAIAYTNTMFVVQWSDGTQSREMYEELDLYEQSVSDSYG
tara:strand:- start:1015 stop:1242 length:228 start_codon:yes stop_codon:yes gene_type:complete